MKRNFSTALATAALIGAGAMAQAATYSSGALDFETQTRQSVWGAGDAAQISDTYFIGQEWDTSFSTGEIVGGIKQTTVPDITYSTRLKAWNACKDSFFSKYCGSKPTDGSFTVTTDTRTGVEADVTTNGKVGFDLNYQLDAGSMAASVQYGASALIPDAQTVVAGQTFSIVTSSAITQAEMDAQSPTANASIDAVLVARADVTAKGCVALLGCASGSGTVLNINEDRELLSIDPNEIKYLDGFTPTGLEITTPLLNQSATLQFNIPTGTPTVEVRSAGQPKPKPVPTVAIDLADATFTVPQFTEQGKLVGGDMVLNARSDFIDLTVDVDTLFAATGILPPGGVSVGFGPVGMSVDAYDFDLGPSFDAFQDLKLTSELMVDLAFSRPVEILGELKNSFVGAWDALPDLKVFGDTLFTPTYFLKSKLESKTGLQITLDATMEFLKAGLSFGAFGFDLLNINLGPLVSEKAELFDFGKLALYDKTFDFLGFEGQRQTAASFLIQPSLPQVPLPPALVMMLAGFGMLFGMRRKSGQEARLA